METNAIPSKRVSRWKYYLAGTVIVLSLLLWSSREGSDPPTQEFLNSELMARAGISETGLTVGQFLEILTLAKQTNGRSPHIDRWVRQSEDNRYILEVSGSPKARLSLEQYRNIPSHPVLLTSAEVDGRNVSPLMFIMEVVAAARNQPDVVEEIQHRKQGKSGAFGTESAEQQAELQKKLRQQAQAERDARTAETTRGLQEMRNARDAYLQAQRDARRAKSDQSP